MILFDFRGLGRAKISRPTAGELCGLIACLIFGGTLVLCLAR